MENSNDYNYEQFELQKGLSGYVAISAGTLLTDDASADIRFCSALDDPNFKLSDKA